MENKYHFLGIGGIGMSALAHILLDRQENVSGSDAHFSHLVEVLEKKGAKIVDPHLPLEEAVNKVIYTTDIGTKHECFADAKKRGIVLMHRSELLQELMKNQKPLLVAGTHGKTTTSSLLVYTLHYSGKDPSFALGGIVKNLRRNGGLGKGEYFVAEADESDGSFCRYTPWGGIVTNIDNDHLDYWKTTDGLIEGFRAYLQNHTSFEHLFWCYDDPYLLAIHPKGISYGFNEKADLVACNFLQMGWCNHFDIRFEGKEYTDIRINLMGGHNVLNASAVFGLCLKMGIPEENIRDAFLSFEGVERRADKKGEWHGALFYDDYAHHPTEILATSRAFKNAFPSRRLVIVFQPHRYTRTRDCFEDFKDAFAAADVLILSDIYAARETPIEGISAEKLKDKIAEGFKKELYFVPRRDLANSVKQWINKEDIVLTMGAGDITFLYKQIVESLHE